MANVGDKLLDKRIVERNIAKGLVSKAEYEKHLADLADREGAYDQLGIELDDTADGVATE
ncbi:MAG: hypothetical protein DRH23_11430 [Deltaproteobacteria bacterium]|jgi:polyribonucleotide nucleotidyltransferase|nr:MAG: hypothetical protein DRH23_11430 [Deltaproteobacteria bacterium]